MVTLISTISQSDLFCNAVRHHQVTKLKLTESNCLYKQLCSLIRLINMREFPYHTISQT